MAEVAATIKIEFTQDEVRQLHQRVTALKAALHALVMVEPIVHNNLGVLICGVCGKREGLAHPNMPQTPFPHTLDCPWVVARAVLTPPPDTVPPVPVVAGQQASTPAHRPSPS